MRLLPALTLTLALTPSLLAQSRTPPTLTEEQIKLRDHVVASYTKHEYRIPMRDGVHLFTAVYVPKDDSKTYPIMLNRTPYSVAPYGADNYRATLGPSALFQREGYIFVYQDVRGRWNSEGEFVNVRPHNPSKGPKDFDESSDTADTIAWLLKNVKGHNGKVGQSGISYPGFYTAAGMIDAHPALVACSPQAPVIDWFVGDDFHHNGCLFLPHAFNFMAGFGKPRLQPTPRFGRVPFEHGTPDGYDFFLNLGPLATVEAKHFKGEIAFWNTMMTHGTYDDFWQKMNLRPHLKDVKPAVLTVGGWFDAENLFGAVHCYKSTEAQSPNNKKNSFVMGPWVHGGWSRGDGDALGHVRFGSKTAEYYREKIEFAFFQHHLKGVGDGNFPEAWVFESGTNVWRKYDAWPPAGSEQRDLVLSEKGKLLLQDSPPTIVGGKGDSFVSDPAKPVPFMERTVIGMDYEYMTADQRHASRRPDVLVYQTEPLTADLTLAGPVEVELTVSTTGTDADWVVKLIDVYPADYPDPDPNPERVKMGNYQTLIRGEPFRGKFRNSFSKPEPFEPGKPTTVKFTMPDVCHAFRPGHRVMVQVQSSWFPLADRNPQTFCDIYSAKGEDFKVQTHTVHHGSKVTVRAVR